MCYLYNVLVSRLFTSVDSLLYTACACALVTRHYMCLYSCTLHVYDACRVCGLCECVWSMCMCIRVLTGADVNAADSTGNLPLHVVLTAHHQLATQQSTPADVTHNSPKALDKASSLHQVIYCTFTGLSHIIKSKCIVTFNGFYPFL